MIASLMQDPIAGAYYANIPATTPPLQLADRYLQIKLGGDREASSHCMAIEAHLRDLARLHFERADVLNALQQMENHKKRRKMGKGAPKYLQHIADQIEQKYEIGNMTHLDDGRIQFTFEDFRVRCKNQPGAVALVVAKYRRGLPKR
jgi:hypothetical protein